MTRVRTRFAPSPTGPLHIGGVRTALYSYLFAKKHGGDFLLRIEDTDTARTVAGSEDVINESLNWCGIIPDEGILQGGPHAPYRQSERKEMYRQYAEQLVQLGKAYLAFDSEDDIKVWREKSASENKGISDAYNYTTRSQMRNSLTLSAEEVSKLLADKVAYVVRLKVDSQDHVSFQDIIRDEVKFKSSQLDDRVLLKSDGMPTYHLANVVDDHLMEISHVIRGEEWLASTPHHILLYKAFGWNQPQFAHLPLFLKPDGKGKLSKRDGDRLGFPVFCTQFVNPDTGDVTEGFREKGFERDAFVNFIAMLGWNDGTERELFDMDALIENFSLERVHKAGAKFNFEKAIWFNQQYLRNLPTKELVNSCSDEIRKVNASVSEDFLQHYVELYRDRVDFRYRLASAGKYIYSDIKEFDTDTFKKKWTPEAKKFISDYIDLLNNTTLDSAEELEIETKKRIEQNQMSMGNILPVLRILLTGTTKGPSLYETILLLGKEKSVERMCRADYLLNS
ncbi:MAG: glutamate--tRNA ligase [Chitinophagales bacterium]|jgi:glutamyl-tRNA synthetase|nr:glutamate--tRNA ligase [Sphingobacteriales bacterium]